MIAKVRKVYRKPEVAQVRLRPREAVLAICKTAMSGGAQGIISGSCVSDGVPSACVDEEGS